ncbi:MAG TPA: hypothetical protein VFQ56_05670 [Flavobacterium sp.]|nr:hypothetical protein [Flavobacterium sp.]
MPKFTALTLIALLLAVNLNSFGYPSSSLHYKANFSFKAKFVGEIVRYSYIKIAVESTGEPKRYRLGQIPLKGSCYEAISGNKYKIIGLYDTNARLWKFDCFNQKNEHISVFIGKENEEGGIEGKWSNKKISRDFYLKKSNN